jgi:hypothetical protein
LNYFVKKVDKEGPKILKYLTSTKDFRRSFARTDFLILNATKNKTARRNIVTATPTIEATERNLASLVSTNMQLVAPVRVLVESSDPGMHLTVGVSVGLYEGGSDGVLDGVFDGIKLVVGCGEIVGTGKGTKVGGDDGEIDGTGEGFGIGGGDGELDGTREGFEVGCGVVDGAGKGIKVGRDDVDGAGEGVGNG